MDRQVICRRTTHKGRLVGMMAMLMTNGRRSLEVGEGRCDRGDNSGVMFDTERGFGFEHHSDR